MITHRYQILIFKNKVVTVEKSHFLNLSNVSVCIKTTSCFGISLSEQNFIADSRVPGQLAKNINVLIFSSYGETRSSPARSDLVLRL